MMAGAVRLSARHHRHGLICRGFLKALPSGLQQVMRTWRPHIQHLAARQELCRLSRAQLPDPLPLTEQPALRDVQACVHVQCDRADPQVQEKV